MAALNSTVVDIPEPQAGRIRLIMPIVISNANIERLVVVQERLRALESNGVQLHVRLPQGYI